MGSEYDLFDITSAMDWYEGEGGLLGGGVQARMPEGAFQQDLLHGLEAFPREQQQPPAVPAWGSQAFSSSYEMSRQNGASTMIPTDSTVGGAHPAGDLDKHAANLRGVQSFLFLHSLMFALCTLPFHVVRVLRVAQVSGSTSCMHHSSTQSGGGSDVCNLLQLGLLYSCDHAHD